MEMHWDCHTNTSYRDNVNHHSIHDLSFICLSLASVSFLSSPFLQVSSLFFYVSFPSPPDWQDIIVFLPQGRLQVILSKPFRQHKKYGYEAHELR